MTITSTSMLLSEAATALARVAIAEPRVGLAAREIQLDAIPARARLTRVRISTADRAGARTIAEILGLDDLRSSYHPGPAWTGYLSGPVLDPTIRALRVDLVLEAEAPEPIITLTEASNLLDLLDAAAPAEIQVARIHLRPRDDADDEIQVQTIYPRDARALSTELAGLDLPLRPVVHARPPQTVPSPGKDAP
jgi:hypothetical protein